MQYEGTVIRPPSEAHSIILQVTAGCSHNKCTFCGAYKEKSFRVRRDYFEKDIEEAANEGRHQRRVFLADGDALILPYSELLQILKNIRESLPWVKGVSLYANGRAIRSKTHEELLHLKRMGLNRVYLGVESGHDEVLGCICKGETAASLIEAGRKVKKSGLFLSTTVLLGIAGQELSLEHARRTGRLLTEMSPDHVGALTLMVLPNTKLADMVARQRFNLPEPEGILLELREMIEHIHGKRMQFYANHASNYLPLAGRLQKDKGALLYTIDKALSGSVELIPEHGRRL